MVLTSNNYLQIGQEPISSSKLSNRGQKLSVRATVREGKRQDPDSTYKENIILRLPSCSQTEQEEVGFEVWGPTSGDRKARGWGSFSRILDNEAYSGGRNIPEVNDESRKLELEFEKMLESCPVRTQDGKVDLDNA